MASLEPKVTAMVVVGARMGRARRCHLRVFLLRLPEEPSTCLRNAGC